MKTFRDYEELIRSIVSKENEKDSNWSWTIKSFGKDLVRIRWEYLDYCEEKDNCFFLKLDDSTGDGDIFITSRNPQDKMIDGRIVAEELKHGWQESYESGIKSALESLFDYAHSRY